MGNECVYGMFYVMVLLVGPVIWAVVWKWMRSWEVFQKNAPQSSVRSFIHQLLINSVRGSAEPFPRSARVGRGCAMTPKAAGVIVMVRTEGFAAVRVGLILTVPMTPNRRFRHHQFPRDIRLREAFFPQRLDFLSGFCRCSDTRMRLCLDLQWNGDLEQRD